MLRYVIRGLRNSPKDGKVQEQGTHEELLDKNSPDFKNKFGVDASEGTYHAILANKLSKELGQSIFFVPRIYADELIQDEPFYLKDLSKILDPKIIMFYCGKNIVSKNLSNYKLIKTTIQNRVIFWDNYYSNDYCPRRLFIGPYFGRENINDVMINPTGLIKTDLLILDIYANNFRGHNNIKEWSKVLEIHGVPKLFIKIKKFFLKPDFGSKPLPQKVNVSDKDFEALDFLLWKWKGNLSREWYPFLHNLKHDLQILTNKLEFNRILKTQTNPKIQKIINY